MEGTSGSECLMEELPGSPHIRPDCLTTTPASTNKPWDSDEFKLRPLTTPRPTPSGTRRLVAGRKRIAPDSVVNLPSYSDTITFRKRRKGLGAIDSTDSAERNSESEKDQKMKAAMNGVAWGPEAKKSNKWSDAKCEQCKSKLRLHNGTEERYSDFNHDVIIMKKMHETQLEVKNRLIKNLEDIIDEQEARIFNIESHLAGLRDLSPSSRLPLKGVVRLADQIEVLTAENVHLRSTLMQEQMDNSKSVENIASSVARIKELEQLLNVQSDKAVTDTEKQLARLDRENNNLQDRVLGLQNQLGQLQKSNEDLQSKCEKLERNHNEVVTEAEGRESSLKQRLQDSREEIASLKNKLGQAETQTDQHKNLTEQTKQQISDLQKSVVTKENDISLLKDRVAELKADNEGLEKKLEASRQTEKNLLDTVAVKDSDMEQLKRYHETEVSEVKQKFSRKSVEAESISLRHNATVAALSLFGESVNCLRMEQEDISQCAFKMQTEFHQNLVRLRQQLSRLVSDSMAGLVKKYKKEITARKHYYNQLVELRGNIRVLSRVRPMQSEVSQKAVEFDDADEGALHMLNLGGRWQTFNVDRVFRPQHTQTDVFDEVRPLVSSCIDGFKVCIFAYGQTGSGKTYTMEGPRNDPGISQRALLELFEETQVRKPDWSFSIQVSMLEIYNEMIRDLLSDEPCSFKLEVKMQEGGDLHVPGLKEMNVASASDVMEIFDLGKKNRATASTNLNAHSSRSHALLCIHVVGSNVTAGVRSTGRLNLVDLAGSERVKKSDATGVQLKEAQSINKSLSALGDVINALKNKRPHVPYRNSKLTYLLQDCLGGESKSLMIVQVAPEYDHIGEGTSSLSFAQRVRSVELGPSSAKVQTINGQADSCSDSEPGNAFSRSGSKVFARSSQRGGKR